jgi:opacity protein-like surface antigen
MKGCNNKEMRREYLGLTHIMWGEGNAAYREAGGMSRTRSFSHPAAGRHSAGSTRCPILMPVSAVALMTGMPSAAYAQCVGNVNSPFAAFAGAATSVITAINGATSVIGTINTTFSSSGPAFLSPTPNSAPEQQSGGVWTRAVGGTVDTKADANFGLLLNVTPPPAAGPSFPVSLSASCRLDVKQNFEGFEVGHDIAVLNVGNSDWHFGALAGYVGAKAEAPPNTSGALQSANFAAPSAGLYAAFSRGAFSADVQGRLYNLEIETLGQRLDARGYSFAGNASYRFHLPGNWTLEPSVGGTFSRTSVDQLFIADASAALGVPTTVFSPLGVSAFALSPTVQINEVESALGRASVTLGTGVPLDGTQVVAYPFVTASVFHEFEGNVTASITTTGSVVAPVGPSPFEGSANVKIGSVGTYAQVGGGSAFQLGNTGWLGYARFDYRTGENIQGYSGSIGLRYQLDEPSHVAENRAHYVKASPKAPAEGYDWTGPYVGVSAGSTRGSTRWTTQGGAVDPNHAGFLGGGQAGYNYQTGRFVWGIEGEGGWSNARGAAACSSQPFLFTCEDDADALGSLTGRFGYTWGRALFYAKGGWAFGEVKTGTSLNVGALPAPGMNAARSANWENGWTVGVGMEYALTERWSAKAEYMHYGFSQHAFTVAQNTIADATTAGDIVRVGLNYHFFPW